MAAYNYQNQDPRLNRAFDSRRMPEVVFRAASPLIKRTPMSGPNVFGENRQKRIPLDLADGGNDGSNVALVDSIGAVPDTASYLIQPGWVATRADADMMDVALQRNSGATNDGEPIQARANRMALLRLMRSASHFGYQGSNKRIARVRTGGLVGSTITVRNPRSLQLLSVPTGGLGTGDVIVLEDSTGALLPGQATCVTKNMVTGTFTITPAIAVAFPTAVAALAGGAVLYVKRKTDSGAQRPVYGMQDFFKIRASQVTASTLGLPSNNDARLAGLRVLINPGDGARMQVLNIEEQLRTVSEGGQPDMLVVTPAVDKKLKAELFGTQMYVEYTSEATNNAMIGFKGWGIKFGWGIAEVHCDEWLYDIDADTNAAAGGVESDELWFFTRLGDHRVSTVKELGPFSTIEADWIRQQGGEVIGQTIGEIKQRYVKNPLNSGWCSPYTAS
jgi:hypothetical protein